MHWERFLKAIWDEGETREIRVLGGDLPPEHAFFKDPASAATAIARYDGKRNVYVTLNPVFPNLYPKAPGGFVIARKGEATSDDQVSYSKFLFFDIDPKRFVNGKEVKGIPSTEEELKKAEIAAGKLRDYIHQHCGVIPFVEGMSGNGRYLIYKTEFLPANESPKLLQNVLQVFAKQLPDDVVLDCSVYNPSRICKVLGVTSVKGEPTETRPHRKSTYTIDYNANMFCKDMLETIGRKIEVKPPTILPAKEPEKPKVDSRHDKIDLGNYNLREMLRKYYPQVNWDKNEHIDCPFHAHHHGRSGAFKERPGGGEQFVCGGDLACPARQHAIDAIRLIEMQEQLEFTEACKHLEIDLSKTFKPIPATPHESNGNSPDLIPIPEEKKVRPYPIDILPFHWQEYCYEVADSIVAPVDWIAGSMITVSSALIGNSIAMQVKPGWKVYGPFYMANVGRVGSGKSPSCDHAIYFMVRIDQELKEENEKNQILLDQQMMDWKIKMDCRKYNMRQYHLGKHSSPPPPPDPMPEMNIDLQAMVSDTTTEAIARLLEKNPRGLLLYKDELSEWISSFNQYRGGKGTDKQFFLSCWSCQTRPVNRVLNKFYLPRTFLCVLGGIPPAEIALLKSIGHDGFFERILFNYPVALERRWSEVSITKGLQERILEDMRFLYRINYRAPGEPHIIDINRDALDFYSCYFNETEKQIENLTNPTLQGMFSKIENYALRFASWRTTVNDHTLQTKRFGETCTKRTMQLATDVAEYYKDTARKVCDMVDMVEEDQISTQILNFAKRKGKKTLKPSDLYQSKVAKIRNSKKAKEVLKLMVEQGYAKYVNPKKFVVEVYNNGK